VLHYLIGSIDLPLIGGGNSLDQQSVKRFSAFSTWELFAMGMIFGTPARDGLWNRTAKPLVAIVLLLTVVAAGRADDEDATQSLAALHSAPCATCQRNDDEVWLIDDRNSGCVNDASNLADGLRFQRYDLANDQWQAATAADFFGGPAAQRPACYWVHGDRIDSSEAIYAGLTVYRRLVEGTCEAPPLRFVIWSWPTTQVYRRPVPDVRLKASRAPATALRLAYVLSRTPADAPVGLIGYSFGARVVAGALHLLAGGDLNGHQLEKPPAAVGHYRAALMASATDYDWLEPGEPNGLALKSVERMLLINNGCDRILAHYRLLACGRHGAPALGYCGVRSLSALGPDAEKVRQFDACCDVGNRHWWRLYICSDSVMGQVRATVLLK